MSKRLDDAALDILFRDARTQNAWTDKPVSEDQIKELHDLYKYGATSANCWPARVLYVMSGAAKDKLAAMAMEGNDQKIKDAPVTAIIGHDLEFYERIPELFPHNPEAREWFAGNDPLIQATAFRNGTLQGAYLMIAARALGLECGPMSGFDNAAVDAHFFAGTQIKSNFICAIGHGDPSAIFDRSPRPDFDSVSQIL